MRCILILFLCAAFQLNAQKNELSISSIKAEQLARVPLECIQQEYPNKLGQVLEGDQDLASPSVLHPIFYGCFDWHSSVHGHWMLANVMNTYPEAKTTAEIVELFDAQFTKEKVELELAYFHTKLNKSFERTYGWGWYLKLVAELELSPLNEEHGWTMNLEPLTELLVTNYTEFLPKLVYPIRVGEHTNTAFGLSLSLDYARVVKNNAFETVIIDRSKEFFFNDTGCPINWEPSGYDFISPCLQEAELMSKVLSREEFNTWIKRFMPELYSPIFSLEVGKVVDRTDGKLVHLDGLNFSRAWCLYGIAKQLDSNGELLRKIGDKHLYESKEQVIGSDYMGSHWLASFYLRALQMR